MGVREGGDNMGEEPKAIPIPPYMSKSPKGQLGE